MEWLACWGQGLEEEGVDANHIVQLRRRPEFTAINQTADRLLRPAKSNSLPEEEVVALFR